MSTHRSVYLDALRFLVRNQESLKVFIYYKYNGINFSPPKSIEGTEIIYLASIDKQFEKFAESGVLKYYEIEPIDIVGNQIKLKIDYSLSIKSTSDTYSMVLNRLSPIEKKVFLRLKGKEPQQTSMYMNIESHMFDFMYDCDELSFLLVGHHKMTSVR